jgi:hypothetical protein
MIAREGSADAEGGEDVAEVVVLNKIVIPDGVVVVGVEEPEGLATMEGMTAETVVALLRPLHEGLDRVPPHAEAIGGATGVALLLVLLPEQPQGPRMVGLGLPRLLRHPPADPVHHALYLVHHLLGSDIASPKADAVQALLRHLVPPQESASVRLRTLVLLRHHHAADAPAPLVGRLPRDHEGHVFSVLPDRVPAAHPLGDVAAV